MKSFTIRKKNVVVDALSRKYECNIPRPNPIVNVNENVLKLVSCFDIILYAHFMA
jgi:hypothetical protein